MLPAPHEPPESGLGVDIRSARLGVVMMKLRNCHVGGRR